MVAVSYSAMLMFVFYISMLPALTMFQTLRIFNSFEQYCPEYVSEFFTDVFLLDLINKKNKLISIPASGGFPGIQSSQFILDASVRNKELFCIPDHIF